MEELRIGRYNTLKSVKLTDFGVYLDGYDYGEILLPKRYVPENHTIGEEIEVFIYFDSEDRIIATTDRPYCQAGEFARLKVVSNAPFGSFLEWGLSKDLFVPLSEQKEKMQVGETYVVYIDIDQETGRLIATPRIGRYLNLYPPVFTKFERVHAFIIQQTDLGYKAIINDTHLGVIYENEIFKPLNLGDKIDAYIKKIREDDRIDLTVHQPGYEKVDGVAQEILQKIKDMGGFCKLGDKASPEEIYDTFCESKKTYKKAIGALYKARLINIDEDGIRVL
jgi:predicted RNA-binding protein (virulence factor B family)